MKNQFPVFYLRDKKKSDKLIDYLLVTYFIAGLLLSFNYDTWLIGAGAGSLSVSAYYSAKYLLPGSDFHQYVLSAVTGVFMAQFIYQTHGMFEMHFFAVIGSIIMITYRNWKLQMPLAIVVLLHHAIFGYLQFAGFSRIYFTQSGFMDLATFFIHCGLTAAIFLLSGLWSHNFRNSALLQTQQSFEIGRLQEINKQKEAFVHLNESLRQTNQELQQSRQELELVFHSIDAVLFSRDMVNHKFIQISAACEKIYGYSAAELMADESVWLKMIHPADRAASPCYRKKYLERKAALYKFRIIHKDGSTRWVETGLTPALDDSGTLIRIDGICNDITARIEPENKLSSEIQQKQREITAAVISAQEKERYFLGEELHDNINPTLATAKLYVDCVLSGDERKIQLLSDSKIFIATAIEEIRTLCKSLIPPSLGEIGLKEAIDGLVENLVAVNSLQIITDTGGVDETILSDNLKLTVFRIVQEQLNNILKHAAAKKVQITLRSTPAGLYLSVKDDGSGFDPKHTKNGVGLQNIRSRTELCNGVVNIASSPGKGCDLMVTFSVNDNFTCISPAMRA